METGHDILFFWVARMVMLGKYLSGQLPFPKVLLHGIICDTHGRKMSKSLGNVIQPEDVITGKSLEELQAQIKGNHAAGILSSEELEKALDGQKKSFPSGIPECGTDALRFALLSHNLRNHFISVDVNHIHTCRLFCNKIWQAARFVLQSLERFPNIDLSFDLVTCENSLSPTDCWILSRLAATVNELNHSFSSQNFHFATEAIRSFFYTDFCDTYLEVVKPKLKSSVTLETSTVCSILLLCLETSLLAMSPLMPFLSEELYQRLPSVKGHDRAESIMVATYPSPAEFQRWRNENLEIEMRRILNVVSVVRRLKKNMGQGKANSKVIVSCQSDEITASLLKLRSAIETLTTCSNVDIYSQDTTPSLDAFVADTVADECTVYLQLKDEIGAKRELETASVKEQRLLKELGKLVQTISREGYKAKAPLHVQEAHKNKITSIEQELRKLQDLQRVLRKAS